MGLSDEGCEGAAMAADIEVYVANLNPNFTGVSATVIGVMAAHLARYRVGLVGFALPGLPAPIRTVAALWRARHRPAGRAFSIWHTRRNGELQVALVARFVLRLPIRVVFTAVSMRRNSGWTRWIISKADAVIAVTDQAASVVGNVWAVVPHGVDCAAFQPVANRAERWASLGYGGARGVAAIGRVRPEKGTDVFVDTMIRALPGLPDVVALVIGMAQGKHQAFQDGLQARIDAAGLAGRIKFIGEISQPELAHLLPGLSLVVPLPRYEGYGMTPLEAMASGVPIVASDVGFFRHFVGEAQDAGRIVAVEDVEAGAAAVTAVLRDQVAFDAAAAQALLRARGQFSIQTEADAIAAVYQRLWASAARP